MVDFVKYMEQVAIHMTPILHEDQETRKRFHRADGVGTLDEFLNNHGHTSGVNLVVIDAEDSAWRDRPGGGHFDEPFKTFLVLQNAEPNDWAQISEVKKNTKYLATQIVWKMKTDKTNRVNGMEHFKTDSVKFLTVGPIGDKYYGCMVTCSFLDHPGCFNESLWTENFNDVAPWNP